MKMNTTEQRNRETDGRKTINNARIMLLCAGMIITMLVLGATWVVNEDGDAGGDMQIVEAAA